MPDIFISYRRVDQEVVDRIHSHLVGVFGDESVFLDRRDIKAGEDFDKTLHEAVASCKVMLVIVSPRWIVLRDEWCRVRIKQSKDWVREEIRLALKLSKRVIPVLISGANPPTKRALPEDLHELAKLQAHFIRKEMEDIEKLVDQLKIDSLILVQEAQLQANETSQPLVVKTTAQPCPCAALRRALAIIGTLVLVLFALVVSLIRVPPPPTPSTTPPPPTIQMEFVSPLSSPCAAWQDQFTAGLSADPSIVINSSETLDETVNYDLTVTEEACDSVSGAVTIRWHLTDSLYEFLAQQDTVLHNIVLDDSMESALNTFNAALIHILRRDFLSAADIFDQLRTSLPHDTALLSFWRGNSFLLAGRYSDAIEAYNFSLSQNFEYALAAYTNRLFAGINAAFEQTGDSRENFQQLQVEFSDDTIVNSEDVRLEILAYVVKSMAANIIQEKDLNDPTACERAQDIANNTENASDIFDMQWMLVLCRSLDFYYGSTSLNETESRNLLQDLGGFTDAQSDNFYLQLWYANLYAMGADASSEYQETCELFAQRPLRLALDIELINFVPIDSSSVDLSACSLPIP